MAQQITEICRKKTYFWRKGKLELPLPCANSYKQSQLQPKSLYCSQSWKNSITYAKYMWKMCVRIAMRYLCSIHIIDAYSSTTTRKMQVHQSIYIGGLYIGGLGEGEAHSKKKCSLSFPFLGHLSPKVYTHYVCFSSFLFPGDLHDSLDILWQPLATCHQGEAMYIGGLGEGRSPEKKKKSLGTSPPKGSHIYLHTLFFFPPSFSLGIFMTLWTFFGNLRKSDNLCGPLAIPSQVYEHKGSNMM